LGITDDDERLNDEYTLQRKPVIVTEKLDGENTTMTSDVCHARSLDSSSHPSRDWVTRLWAEKRYRIPPGYSVCGENVFATHSIHYNNLETYFYVFSVWDNDFCLSWDDTVSFCKSESLIHVPVLETFPEWSDNYADYLAKKWIHDSKIEREGFVVRYTSGFHLSEFGSNVAKWVRQNHVTTDEHWLNKPLVKNELTNH
jgi:hypothetical protein